MFVGSVLKDLLDALTELQGLLPIDPTIELNFKLGTQQLVNLPNLTDKRIKLETGGRRLDKIIGLNISKIMSMVQEITQEFIFIDAIYRYPDCDNACRITYAKSINNLKTLKHIIPGLMMMQKDRLKDFWSKLDLPNDLKYFSLSATMPEPYLELQKSKVTEYTSAYDGMKSNIDSIVNRISYYSYVDKLGHTINDGQVSAAHSMFREDYLAMGSKKNYDLVDLGVIGATHWEVALAPVFATPDSWKNSSEKQPMIHTSIFQALIRVIANDQ